MGEKYCSQCGSELKDNPKFCPVCGNKVKKEISNEIPVIKEEIPNNENKISKIRDKLSDKTKNLNKKHKIIIGVVILIIAVALILVAFGVFGNSPSHIKDVKVYNAEKVYKIEFSCDIPYDKVMVTLYKDGEAIYNSKGTYGEFSEDGGSSVVMELAKDVEPDEILFNVYDDDLKVLDSGFIKDFKIDKKGSLSEIGVYREDTSQITAKDLGFGDYDDDYEIAKSHRDLYDYDGDGILNDYEFRQFCIGEGQEDLLDL